MDRLIPSVRPHKPIDSLAGIPDYELIDWAYEEGHDLCNDRGGLKEELSDWHYADFLRFFQYDISEYESPERFIEENRNWELLPEWYYSEPTSDFIETAEEYQAARDSALEFAKENNTDTAGRTYDDLSELFETADIPKNNLENWLQIGYTEAYSGVEMFTNFDPTPEEISGIHILTNTNGPLQGALLCPKCQNEIVNEIGVSLGGISKWKMECQNCNTDLNSNEIIYRGQSNWDAAPPIHREKAIAKCLQTHLSESAVFSAQMRKSYHKSDSLIGIIEEDRNSTHRLGSYSNKFLDSAEKLDINWTPDDITAADDIYEKERYITTKESLYEVLDETFISSENDLYRFDIFEKIEDGYFDVRISPPYSDSTEYPRDMMSETEIQRLLESGVLIRTKVSL